MVGDSFDWPYAGDTWLVGLRRNSYDKGSATLPYYSSFKLLKPPRSTIRGTVARAGFNSGAANRAAEGASEILHHLEWDPINNGTCKPPFSTGDFATIHSCRGHIPAYVEVIRFHRWCPKSPLA